MKMAAAVLSSTSSPFEVEEVDIAAPRAGEVLVRIAASGLCASDLNAYTGKRALAPFPTILGHEAAGVVEEVGPAVETIRAGDHVVLSIVPHCGTCDACRRGRPNYCETAGDAMSGGNLFDGSSRLSRRGERLNHFLTVSSFAEYAVVPVSGVVRIDRSMPLDRAALLSCAVLTGFGAVQNRARVRPGQSVAVFGCGGVGLNIVQGARMAGADPIIAVDVRPEKLDVARAAGATHLVDSSRDEPSTAVRDLSGGGVDFAFEAVGRQDTVRQAWASLGIGGEAVIVGLMKSGEQLTLDSGPFVEEKRIGGCYFGSAVVTRDVPTLVSRYQSGELLLDELISRRIGLTELDDAFQRLQAGEEVRQVLVFDSDIAKGGSSVSA